MPGRKSGRGKSIGGRVQGGEYIPLAVVVSELYGARRGSDYVCGERCQ